MEENIIREQFIKGFFFSFSVGAFFGIILAIGFAVFGDTSWPFLYYLPLVIFPGLVAGSGGILGGILEMQLKKRGWGDEGLRRGISFFVVAFLAMIIGLMALYFWGRPFLPPGLFRNAAFAVVGGILFGGAVALFDYRRWKVKRKMLELELENRFLSEINHRDQLLQDASRNLILAEERNRMARELHDSISQGVHGIVYGLQSLKEHLADSDKRGSEILNHLQDTSEATLRELKELIGELKPSQLEDQGLEEALGLYSDLCARRHDFDLTQNIDYPGGLSPEQEVAIYRITQEAFSNIGRHAAAKKVHFYFGKEKDYYILEISDDGRGFATENVVKGQGLDNMAARARQASGWLEINSQPDNGTILRVELSRLF